MLVGIDTNDWRMQQAGYPPQSYDLITSGGWLALLFLILCFVTGEIEEQPICN